MIIPISLCFTESHAVDDRRVVQAVGYDCVLFSQHSLEEPRVRVEPAREQNAVLHSVELSQFLLELLVDRLRAADKPH